MTAVSLGANEIFEMLYDMASVEEVCKVDAYGRNVLHFACAAKNEKAVSIILDRQKEKPVDVNAVTKGGETPLMMAVKGGSVTVVQMCL